MAVRAPQIVAFGGGGFSMEAGNPRLDDYVLALTGVARPRVCFVPTASGDADHYVVRFYRALSASRCEPSHISLFRRDRRRRRAGRRPRGAPARAGSRLRRRRLRRVAARRLACARRRRDPCRGVAARDGAVRAERRVAVLVRRGGDRLPRRPDAGRGSGAAAVVELRALRRRAAAAHGVPPLRRRRHARGLRGRGRRGAALRGRAAAPRRDVARGEAGVHGRAARRRHRGRGAAGGPGAGRRRCGRGDRGRGGMTAAPTILALGGGGFTTDDGDPALDDLVLELAPARVPRVLFLPTASGDPGTQIARFRAAFGARPCEPDVLSLFRLGRAPRPLAEVILAQDVIYVGGGSLRNLLAIWR